MCNGYFYFDLLAQMFSKDWAYLAEFVVQDAMYVIFDMGDEIDIIAKALGRESEMMMEMEEEAEDADFEDETTFQVDIEDGEFVGEEGEGEEMMMESADFFEAGTSLGRIISRLFSSSVDIGA